VAAPTINANLTNISTVEDNTGFAGFKLSGAGSAPGPQTEFDIFVHGAGACSARVSGSADKGIWFNNGSGIDFTVTGRHLWIWVNYTTPGNLTTFNGSTDYGLYIVVSTSGSETTDYLSWSVRDRTTKPVGWERYVIDLNKPPSRSVGSTNLASIQYIGAGSNQTGTVKSENLVIDRIDYGTGLQVEDGDSTTPASWDELWLDDDGQLNKYGVIQKRQGAYFLRGGIEIGDSAGTATTLWNDTSNSTVIFENPTYLFSTDRVELSSIDADNLYSIDVVGNGTGTTDVTFGSVVGAGDARQGILGGAIQSAGPKWSLDAETDIADLDTVNLYGMNIQGAGNIQLSSSTKTDVIGTTFVNCDEIQPNDCEFLNNTVIAPVPDRGVELTNATNFKNISFVLGESAAVAFSRVWQVDASGPTYVDFTDQAESTTTLDWDFFPATEAVGDYCAMGYERKFTRARIDVGTARVGGTVAWEYYNGSTWSSLPIVFDNTNDLSTTGLQNVEWLKAPADWAALSINGELPLFYIRIRVTGTFTTNPVGDRALCARQVEHMLHVPSAGSYTADTLEFFGSGSRSFEIENSASASTADSYSETNQSSNQALGNGIISGVGQSFTGDGTVLSSARWYLAALGSPSTGNIQAHVYAHSGTFGTSSVPTGSPVASSNIYDASALDLQPTTGTSYRLVEFEFEDEFTLVNLTNYVVTLEYGSGNVTNHVLVGTDNSLPSASGNFATYNGTTWTANSSVDACFYADSGGIVTINATDGSNPSVDQNTGTIPGATIINNAVNVTVNVQDEAQVAIENARVYVEATTGGAEILNALTNASGVATTTFNYPGSDTAITVRVRKSTSGSTRYYPVQTTGTITSTGFSVDVTMTVDQIASA
jgi:hypothetical protein